MSPEHSSISRSISLLGHNGAGKSTLIKWLLGLYITPNEHPFLRHFSHIISPISKNLNIGYAPEEFLLSPNCIALDYLKWLNIQNFADVADKLAFKIDIKMPFSEYSKGMKRLFCIALSLCDNYDVIILDEPTDGLDYYANEAVQNFLLNETRQIIISTHSLDLAYKLGFEIWILRKGELVRRQNYGDYGELLEDVKKAKPC